MVTVEWSIVAIVFCADRCLRLLYPAFTEFIDRCCLCCIQLVQYFQLHNPVVFKVNCQQVVAQNYIIQLVPANQALRGGARQRNTCIIQRNMYGLENPDLRPADIA